MIVVALRTRSYWKQFMKTKCTLALILSISVLADGLSKADDWFQISWSGTVHYYDSSGRMITKGYSSKDVLNTIAANYGLSTSDLALVYRPDAYDTAVVFKNAAAMNRAGVSSEAQVVADYIQMPDVTRVGTGWITDVSGNGQTARQAYLFDEHDSPIGSIVGIEKQKRDGDNNLVSESFHGTWQFSIPDDSHTIGRPGVYSGTFSTGGRVKDIRGQ
jgi:hypothetical protein